jgi:cyanate permease
MTSPEGSSPPPGVRTYGRYRFVIGGLILAVHFTVGLNAFVVSPILPLAIDDFGISRATASLLVALVSLSQAAFGLPGGILVTRFGLKRVYSVAWLLIAVSVLAAVAPNFVSLVAVRVAFGIGFGIIIPATGPLLMQWFRPREVLMMNGLDIALLSLGVSLSIATVSPLSELMEWQHALGIYGGVGVLGAIAWLVLGKAQDIGQTSGPSLSRRDVWGVLRNRVILLLVAADALVFMQYAGLTSWLPTFFNETRGMSLNQAGFVTGLLPFVGIFAVLTGGALGMKYTATRPFFLVPGLLVGVGGLGSFLFGNIAFIYLAVILLGVGSWSFTPKLLSLPMELVVTQQKVAVVWGTFVTVSGTCMFLSPIVIGALRDVTGSFVPGFAIFGVGAWFLFLAGILYPMAASRSKS